MNTPESPRTHSDFALLVDEVSRLRGRFSELLAGREVDVGVSAMAMTVLTATYEAKVPPTVAQIGRSLGHPRQVIQRAAHGLAAQGLIRMDANPAHKRAPILTCTPAGIAAMRAGQDRAGAITAAVMQSLDPADLRAAVDLLHRIRRRIETHIKERRP